MDKRQFRQLNETQQKKCGCAFIATTTKQFTTNIQIFHRNKQKNYNKNEESEK